MPSKISKVITLRLKNEQVAVIDRITECGGYANRNEACRDLLAPGLLAGMVAMQSGSVSKALTTYWKEMNLMKNKMKEIADNSKELREADGQSTLDLGVPKIVPDIQMGGTATS